jgi:hypothetical protein
VTVYASPDCCRFTLFVEIVAAASDEGLGMAIAHHVGTKVSAIDMANRDGASVAIQGLGLAGDLPDSNERPQVFGSSLPCRPSVSARLVRLGRVDPPQSIGHNQRPGEYRHQRLELTGHRPVGLQTRERRRGRRVSSDFGSVKLRPQGGERQAAQSSAARSRDRGIF